MSLSLEPSHLARYKDLLRVLVKHGGSGLVERARLEEVFRDEEVSSDLDAEAEDLADDLEELGPTFVKLGQLLSTRGDLLPLPYLRALQRLQDRLEPFPFEDVERIVSEDLGVRVSKAFGSFEREPIAAASLGQVHRATLRDGRPVAVKVQRPEVRGRVLEDVEVLGEVAEWLEAHSERARVLGLVQLVEEFRRTVVAELDYRSEARNLTTLSNNLEGLDRIIVPLPVEDYTGPRVLTMDFVRGLKITDVGPVARLELRGGELADQLFQAYLRQVLVDGFFHADPHPGNVFLTSDHRLALLDLGMVAQVPDGMQEELLRLLLAVAEGRGDEVAEVSERLGTKEEGFAREAFHHDVGRLVARYGALPPEQIQVGRGLLEVTRMCAEHRLRPPSELAILGKTLLNLDEISRTLDPTYDPNEAVRRYSADIMRRRAWRSISPGNVVSAALEMNELVQKLPRRLNRVLERLAEDQISLQVDAIDEHRLISGLEKIANRITVGLVIAALIVGAALLMRVETDFTLFGYPGLAMILFLIAAGAGLALVWRQWHGDEPP